MSDEFLIFITLLLTALFLWNVWGLRCLYQYKRCGVCVMGRVVHCEYSYENCRATIRYCAGNGVWEIYDFADPTGYGLGQEVPVHYLPGAPSEGFILDNRAWFDAWAGIFLPFVAEAFFICWPFFGFGD